MGLYSWITKPFKGSKQTVVTRASKGLSRDLYTSIHRPGFRGRSEGTPSPENLNLLLQIFQKDPVVNAALTTRVNSILESGYTIEGKSTPLTEANRKLKKFNFNYSFLRKLFLNGLLYRHVFIEIERTMEGSPDKLHILETTQMEIEHDEHGEILQFYQRASNGEKVYFPIEDIVYIPFDSLTSGVWGEVDIKSLYRTITTKNLIEEFIKALAESNAWRQVIKTKMNEEEIGSFLSYLYDSFSDPLAPLVMQTPKDGDANKDDVFQVLRDPAELKEFLGLLDYLRGQILTVLKVPRIVIGLPDNSNRSNSDAQFKIYNTNNESDRKIVSDAFNNELFPKLGLSTVEFSWNPIDKRSEKDDVEMAEKLMNMGADPKKVEEFLRLSGLELPEGRFFKEQPVEMKTPDDAASRPSRQREDKSGDMNNIGTGRDSSTRPDQMGG